YCITPAPLGRSRRKDRKGLFYYLYSIFFSSKMSNVYKSNRRLEVFNRRLVKLVQALNISGLPAGFRPN
ncbi:MAG: hypothetical protein PVF26_06015, partial [Desulfobacterales bacterium]